MSDDRTPADVVDPDRPLGSVEAETRDYITGLGRLSAKRRVHAAHALALARQLDHADTATQPLSAVGTVSRRLAVMIDTLLTSPSSTGTGSTPKAQLPKGVTAIGSAQRSRASRRAAAGGQS